jgi:hypothetical protein
MVRAVVLVAVLMACNSAGSKTPAPGSERGACYGNGTCDDGLSCLSDRCVRVEVGSGSGSGTTHGSAARPIKPAAGMADCAAVAETLVSLELGNYAPRDQRAGRAADIAALCRAQFVTTDEAACLLAATRKDDLALCPKPLIVKALTEVERTALQVKAKLDGLPTECLDYIKLLERYATCAAFPQSGRDGLRQTIDQMKSSWQQMLDGQVDPSMQQMVRDACKQGNEAMRQAMAQIGC